jgi:alpha-mannosidase
LLNDAKYGHSARGNVLGISLVRGPIYPDPTADEGEQRFTYALLPHAGEWHSGGVREEADDLNQPLIVAAAVNLAETTLTPIAVTGTPVALSAIKPAEDGGGLVLRVYEPAGRRGGLAVTPAEGWTISEAVNLMEEPAARDAGPDILPFEVRSWMMTRA